MIAIYGQAPTDLGRIDIDAHEMMFWLYLPIKLPGGPVYIRPDNVKTFDPILRAVERDMALRGWIESYIYLTAKTLYTERGSLGGRPGWHSDGFGTEDVNYIWYDRSPTVFWVPPETVALPDDHEESMCRMHELAEHDSANHRRYPVKHLLRMDSSVIHKPEEDVAPGVRTFVKISVSRHRYSLIGNSVNHALRTSEWNTTPRAEARNCPTGAHP